MSKKHRKPRLRASRKSAIAATKRPAAASSEHDMTERIARALEVIASHLAAASPTPRAGDSFGSADAFVWHPNGRLAPVPRVSRVDLGLLKGIDRMRDILIENTARFANGLPANNALLWGARDMMENERSTAINPGEAVEEKVSLSDRFGLWLGFHRCSQDEYLAMVKGYCGHFGIKLAEEELEREALEWSTTRGSRSGRVAWQFTQELAGRLWGRLSGK